MLSRKEIEEHLENERMWRAEDPMSKHRPTITEEALQTAQQLGEWLEVQLHECGRRSTPDYCTGCMYQHTDCEPTALVAREWLEGDDAGA